MCLRSITNQDLCLRRVLGCFRPSGEDRSKKQTDYSAKYAERQSAYVERTEAGTVPEKPSTELGLGQLGDLSDERSLCLA